jgi:hypothetical protein
VRTRSPSPLDPEKVRRKRALGYIWKATGFASCGYWPTFRADPYMTMPRHPEHPPADMTEDEVARANKWLTQRNWLIVRGAERWALVRQI